MKPFTLVLLILSSFIANAQVETFKAKPLGDQRIPGLESELASYDLFSIDIKGLDQYVHGSQYGNQIVLDLPGFGEFSMDLIPNPVRTEDYKLRIQTPEGVVEVEGDGKVKTFKGYVNAQHEVRLTIDDDYISGFIQTRRGELMIESANLRDKDLPDDQILVYYNSDVIAEYPNQCEPLHAPDYFGQEDPEKKERTTQRVVGECYDVEIAYANDWLMYEERNEDLEAVENHNITVMNNVQSNYDDEFLDEVTFVISEIFVSTCSSCDPWTSSTSASQLLNSFSGWAGSGFGTHDVATLWTDRDFNGQTIGLAWLSSVCFNNFKYNTCQDFTGNSNFLRVLLAHELGHNFSAEHDGDNAPHIMAPSVQNTSTWSDASVTDISDYVDGAGCLSFCAAQEPPVADLGSDITEGCIPLTVQFEDQSAGLPDSWNWSFPGGTPSSSSEENPVVTYNQAGTYDVTLEVTNAIGTDMITLQDYITVLPNPEPDFTYTSDQLTVFFENLSTNADTYFWDFGDGQVSDEENPIHNYSADGAYIVTLTATNGCSSEDYIFEIEVVSLPIAAFTFTPEEGCVPLTVDFENLSSDNAITYLWEFEGGDPLSSNDENPTVTYHQTGVFGVTLTVGNSAGDDIAIQDEIIIVNPLPVADFNMSVAGNSVSFDNLSTDSYGYTWDFGDGNTSNEFEPEHAYDNGGVYTITLISEGDCGTDTFSLQVSISAAPIAGIGVSVSEGCAPLEVQYNSQATGDVEAYQWSFPGGNPSSSTDENPVVTYTSPGVYSATLIVTNSIGSDTLEMTNVVTVPEDVNADFSFDINGQEVQFVDESSNQQSIEWQINGQVFSVPNPVVNFGMDGEFTALLIATGPCGTDTAVSVITIATPPTAGFNVAGGGTSGCAPLEVQFSNASSDNVSAWSWSFPGGNPSTSNAPNPTVVYATAGTYSVSLLVTSGGGQDEMVMNDLIAVGDIPDADFNTNQSGTVVQFQDLSINADEIIWFFGDGSSSTEMNPSHDYGAFGTYEVMLIASNECGADTNVFSLELQGLPVPDFSVVQSAGCIPLEVTFEDLSQNMPDTWEWSFPGGNPSTSNEQNPVIVYSAPGVYDVSLTASNATGSESITRTDFILVEEEPVAWFDVETSGDNAAFTNESEYAGSYFWDFGDGTTSDLPEPEHVYPGSGTYLVTLIATNSCGSDTVQVEVVIETTLYVRPDLGAQLEVWPNPNRGEFWLDIDDHTGEVQIDVYDVQGQRHFKDVVYAPLRTVVTLKEAPPGLYFVKLSGEGRYSILKIVVE